MGRTPTKSNDCINTLRTLALGYPEVKEGTACTRSSFKARDKSFLFLGSDDHQWTVMLKLRDSLKEAQALADRQPAMCKVGASGWATLTFGLDQSPPPGMLERWIDESYRLLAPRQLVARLEGSVPSKAPGPKKTAHKAVKKNKPGRI